MHPIRLRPAYATDSPVIALTTAEHLLLTVVRLWVAPYRDPRKRHPDWRQGLGAAGLGPEAAAALDASMRILATATRRPLDLRCPRCPYLGMDEGGLLQAVAALQAGRSNEAEQVLAGWLPAAAVRMALTPLASLALALERASLRVPARAADDRPTSPTATETAGSLHLH